MFVYNIVVLFGFAISPAVSSAVRNLASISTCRASEFTCLDGTCVRAGAVCDTNWDCPDGSDEASCYSSTNSNLSEATESHERYRRQTPCGFDQWRCTDGTCIAVDGKCNGKIDCPDSSDEAHALCTNINSSTVSGKCVLPPYPEHGSYVAINAPYATPGQSLQYAHLNVTCEQGYGLVSDTMPYCLDGTWFISIQKCVPFCRLYPDVSVHYYCQSPGTNGYRICNQLEPLGTFIRPECNTPIYGSRDWPLYMICQNDGKWNRIIKCKAECGRVTPAAEGLISGGTEAVRGELPWHVGIYQKPTQKRNYYKQICGGSLISNWIVISAAHCFWDKVKQEKRAASNYAVATGKLYREWDHRDDKDAQKSELRSIEIPPRYLGVRLNFDHDIAVLILETPVVYYTYVRPVCLDLLDPMFNDVQLRAGNFGKVAGWGLTGENGPASSVLKAVQLPFVPFRECIGNTPETFTESITWDKICAGYSNGTTAVCKGDSGGGLSFPDIERGANRYYLRGVASTAPRGSQECNVATVTTFTAIYQHKDFINQFIGRFRCKDGSSIPDSDLCDGNPNCPDGSDEAISACAAKKCPVHLFQCADGACVDQGCDCNRIKECADGSDESDELNPRLPTNLTVTNRPIQPSNSIQPPYPEHGAACEWDGVKGICMKETQCMTTLDTRGDKHLVCTKKGDVTIVCCTDCELVNDTRNVVMDPRGGFYWKDGTKARDSCLQYLKDLPYMCREGGFHSGISRNYNEEKKCHTIGLWGTGGAPPLGSKSGAEYPHQAMLGYGPYLASAEWVAGGSIVSNNFILTAAHVAYAREVEFVALGVERRSDSPTAWQTHKVKRFIPHPDYKAPSKYNDIALIELETPITFNENVLPACLHVEAANAETAIATTWRDLKSNSYDMADVIQTINNLDVFTEEECKTAYHPRRHLKDGINYSTQMCYGSKSHSPDACMGLSGEPLLITTQFSSCIYTVIGVTSFGNSYCGSNHTIPDVYTRVAHYKPWIESVVWA